MVFADNIMTEDCRDSIFVSTVRRKKFYAVKGLKDYVIVDTGDVLLICPKDYKQFKDFLSGLGMPEYESFR